MKTGKSIIGYDLGSTTGWAAENAHGLVLSGCLRLKGGRYEGGGMRFLRFRKALEEQFAVMKPEAVFFEEVRRHRSTDSAHVYGGLLAVLTSVCEEAKIPYIGIPVGTIKKTATGKGNAEKAFMIKSAKARWPDQDICDDNQADALWVLETGKGMV